MTTGLARWGGVLAANCCLWWFACCGPLCMESARATDRGPGQFKVSPPVPPAVAVVQPQADTLPETPAVEGAADAREVAGGAEADFGPVVEMLDSPPQEFFPPTEGDDPPDPLGFRVPESLDIAELPAELRVLRIVQHWTDQWFNPAEELTAEDSEEHGEEPVPAPPVLAQLAFAQPQAAEAADRPQVAQEAESPPPAVENPLGRLLQLAIPRRRGRPGVNFKFKRPPVAGGPVAGVNLNENSRARHKNASDPTVAHDAKKAEWLQLARRHIALNEWRQAFDFLQRIVEHPEDALCQVPPAQDWVSIRSEARRLQGTAPDESLQVYRDQFGGLAQQLLSQANQTSDLGLLARVSRQYFHTRAGYEAADRLGNLLLDRGEYALAGLQFHPLWEVRAPATQTTPWKLKALFTYIKGNQKAWADELRSVVAPANSGRAEIGGKPVDLQAWIHGMAIASPAASPVLDEWLTAAGNPQRNARTAGSVPLLISRWSVPTTQLETFRKTLEQLYEDLSDQRNVPLPAFQSVMVNGKIAFRTFRGVQVVEARTGKPLWHTECATPADEFLSQRPEEQAPRLMMKNRIFMAGGGNFIYNSQMADNGPLSNLAYRNNNFGLISSDGARLFVLEDSQQISAKQPGQYWWDDGSTLRQNTNANQLIAYDLESGHAVWEVGGDEEGDAFELPLAGTFFFGPPLFDGEQLLVVGELNSETRLFALDPATGRTLWSQLIGTSEASIGRDIGRRWIAAQPAVADGVIVVPTTSHWIVGIDRTTRSLLWGRPLARSRTTHMNDGMPNEMQAMVPYSQLTGRWSYSPPIIFGQKVYCTTPETNQLLCLDLFTGKELWQIPRGEMLCLAGVFDSGVLLLGKNIIEMRNSQTGQQLWPRVATPTIVGRGVAVGDQYYFPCANGELCCLDLKKGTLGEKSFLAGTDLALGNLLFYRGMLLSLSPREMIAFEQFDALHAQIAERKAANPRDPWANLREAEIQMLHRDAEAALQSLERIPESAVPAELSERFRELLTTALVQSIQAHPLNDNAERLQTLQRISTTPLQRLNLRRLLAHRAMQRKDYVAAFETYLGLAEEAGTFRVLADDDPAIQVDLQFAIAGKLADLWLAVPPADRLQLDALAEQQARKALSQPVESQLKFIQLFGMHPAVQPVVRAAAQQLAATGRFLEAERMLLRVRRSLGTVFAAEATERLARLMLEFKQPEDAASYYQELETTYAQALLPEGKSGAAHVAALRATGNLPNRVSAPLANWSNRQFTLDRLGTNYSEQLRQDLSRSGSRREFFRRHMLQVNRNDQRLEVIRLDKGDLYWGLPLRSNSSNPHNNPRMPVVAESSEHGLVVLHQGVLHGLSPVERKILWTRVLETRIPMNVYYNPAESPITPLQSLQSGGHRRAVTIRNQTGQSLLAFANAEVVGYLSRRTLIVLDAVTGDVRWTLEGIGPGTRFYAGGDYLSFRSTGGAQSGKVQILRTLDGKHLSAKHLENQWDSILDQVGDHDLVLASPQGSQFRKVRRIDPISGIAVWEIDLPRMIVGTSLDNDSLAILDPERGDLGMLALETGKLAKLAKIPLNELRNRTELFSFVDFDNLYLIVNNEPNPNYYQEQIPFVRASGAIYAFDLATQKLRWKQNVSQQNLILERLNYNPLLVFATRRFEQKGSSRFWSFNLRAVDKMTGQLQVNESTLAQNTFQNLLFHPAEQVIELRGYNERLRIAVREPIPPKGDAPNKPAALLNTPAPTAAGSSLPAAAPSGAPSPAFDPQGRLPTTTGGFKAVGG